ncbi:hypothetical protein ACRQTN_07200 [Pectobacterium brasiliense]|uniref:hypothetical protein n=1 Tax=Pectobacterium brasiliense TaxID=180957 RepID=UPI003EBCD556
MSKIEAVRVENKLIILIPHKAEHFGQLFEIDSVSLLLGINGSGKTRMLVSIANAIGSSQDDSFQFYFQDTPNGKYEPSAPYNKNICSVYYSALPYKRKLLRRRGILNASPKKKSSTDNKRIEKFGEVSEILKINTYLTGVLGYSRNVFRTIIIPFLRGHYNVKNSKLNKLIYELNELSEKINMNKLEGYRIYDQERELILNDIEKLLENEISNEFDECYRIIILSILEYMYFNGKRDFSKLATGALLNHLGVINFKSDKEIFTELKSFVETTKIVLDKYCLTEVFDRNDKVIRFKIDSLDKSKEIGGYDTPIQIEWSNQSSGLQALVEQFSLIDDTIGKAVEKDYKSVLLLIDEGDAYLHLEWQRKYFSILNKFLGGLKRKYNLKNLQLIMATHSPLLAADIPSEFVTSLDTDERINSFAAPMEEVISRAFSSNSLGEFAATKINEIYKRAVSGNITQSDRNMIESIGDVSIKSALKRSVKNDY